MGKALDKVIGYQAIKTEFLQLLDILQNPASYKKFKAELPKGFILDGQPGLGKTFMCKCFIEDAGIPTYTVRRNAGDEDFIESVTSAYEEAKQHAPAIVFLDDLDKAANSDKKHRDCPEYVAVQSGIDSCAGYTVFTLATTNDIDKLPESLIRPGRFDRTISVPYPSVEDSILILKHYMEGKNVDPDINLEDIVHMTGSNAVCVLETVINEAGINAAYAKSEYITIEHILQAVLRLTYKCPDDTTTASDEEIEKNAMHEASHAVMAECLVDGSIGLVSIKKQGRNDVGGFVHRCKPLKRRCNEILVSLASKVGTELYYPNVASGCNSDLSRAHGSLFEGLSSNATFGYSLLDSYYQNSNDLTRLQEQAVAVELERYSVVARNILLANRDFLEKVSKALVEKGTLLYSDMQAIKGTCTIKHFEIQ